MKKSDWSDKQLEEYLRQMPKIQDHRHPRDIYHKLSLKRRKRPNWLVPSIATAAAVVLLFILGPNLLGGLSNHSTKDQASIEKKMADTAQSPSLKMEKNGALSGEATLQGIASEGIKTAVYEDEVAGGKVLTYWIPDEQARFLIPVSTVVYDTGDKTWITLFNEKMSELQEENWGLSEYYPMTAKLELDQNNELNVDVPADNQYVNGSTNETIFRDVLEKDAASNSNVKKIKFTTNSQPGIEFGNAGKVDELIVEAENHYAYFFYYSKGSTVPFLVPSSIKYDDIQTALTAMEKGDSNLDLKASLSPFSIKTVTHKEKTLYLSLDEQTELMNDNETLYAFEALLLTAKEFGFEYVAVKNSSLVNLGPFDLSKEVKVPVAPNLRFLQ